jgi:hypothetical protein
MSVKISQKRAVYVFIATQCRCWSSRPSETFALFLAGSCSSFGFEYGGREYKSQKRFHILDFVRPLSGFVADTLSILISPSIRTVSAFAPLRAPGDKYRLGFEHFIILVS